MDWKNNFEKGKELILATSSKEGIPHTNIVNSLGFIDEKLLIKDSQMHTTINNLRENKYIALVSGYIRIKGTAEIFSSWKYLDICNEKSNKLLYPAKNAILITIEEIFDLDKMEKIKF